MLRHHLDSWALSVLVDPHSKGPLTHLPRTDGIPDFRVRLSPNWEGGQKDYERWQRAVSAADGRQNYRAEIEGVRAVYEAIPLHGDVLDVGGHQGRVREFLTPGQRYLSCDPFLYVFNDLDEQPNLLRAYKCLSEPCNFVAANAEHLPIAAATFDTVHMRSVIDHFDDAVDAVAEAKRVLRPGGQIVIGSTLFGGREGRQSLRETAKEAIRALLPFIGVTRFNDHHMWHPTFVELCELLTGQGFQIRKIHWQAFTRNRVCYVAAVRA